MHELEEYHVATRVLKKMKYHPITTTKKRHMLANFVCDELLVVLKQALGLGDEMGKLKKKIWFVKKIHNFQNLPLSLFYLSSST